MKNSQFKRSPVWKERKEDCLAMHGYKCTKCGRDYKTSLKTDNPVSVYPLQKGTDLYDCTALDLWPLCRVCYVKEYSRQKKED